MKRNDSAHALIGVMRTTKKWLVVLEFTLYFSPNSLAKVHVEPF